MGLNKDVKGNLVGATVGDNALNLNNINGPFNELGGSVNLAGTANGNVVNVTNSTLTLSNPGKFFGDTLDLNTLSANQLLSTDIPTDKGAIFGGASMTYSRTVNSTPEKDAPKEEKVSIGGTNSDNNTVSLAGGDSVKDVKANVFGGFSAYINEVNYQTKDDSGVITTVKKEGLVTKTTSSGPDAEEGTDEAEKLTMCIPHPTTRLFWITSNSTVKYMAVMYMGPN